MEEKRESTRTLGARKEEAAVSWLRKRGVRIIERNFRCKQGEIDIIGRDGEYLVFFEVKYRKNAAAGSASEAVGTGKQKKIRKVSDFYRMIHGYPLDTPVRFDVIAIDGAQLEWIRNAFGY